MPRIIPAVLLAAALPLAPSAALAAERVGDAALGALSGGVVLGPFGAVAGAVVGYTTGPDIAHAWGLRPSPHHRRTRSASAAAPAPKARPTPLPRPRPDAVPSARSPAPIPRPDAAPSARSPAPIRAAAGGAPMPPVQSLE